MKTYAYVVNNVIVEVILPAVDNNGDEISIDERFHPDFVSSLVDISKNNPQPLQGYILKNNKFVSPVNSLSVEDKLKLNEIAIQNALDAKAAERGYSSIKSACAYASPVAIPTDTPINTLREKFRQEGNALQTWMGQVWATAYIHQDAVIAGTEECPTEDEAVALMPELVWPSV